MCIIYAWRWAREGGSARVPRSVDVARTWDVYYCFCSDVRLGQQAFPFSCGRKRTWRVTSASQAIQTKPLQASILLLPSVPATCARSCSCSLSTPTWGTRDCERIFSHPPPRTSSSWSASATDRQGTGTIHVCFASCMSFLGRVAHFGVLRVDSFVLVLLLSPLSLPFSPYSGQQQTPSWGGYRRFCTGSPAMELRGDGKVCQDGSSRAVLVHWGGAGHSRAVRGEDMRNVRQRLTKHTQ